MLLFKTIIDLQFYLSKQKAQGRPIGFVPTMGALHEGHLSLIEKCREKTGVSVCSIFVNPTQFNEKSDLDKYPRTTSADIEKLTGAKCDVLFLPSASEIYPSGPLPLNFDFGYLDQPMEGAHRPGHFAGMAQVVKRLLDIVQPDQLFMGQKDFQQAAIVRYLIEQQEIKTELVVCPIVREADGLAMSSRNIRLTKPQRRLAPKIFETLSWVKSNLPKTPLRELEKKAMKRLAEHGLEPEYFNIVDGNSLRPAIHLSTHKSVVACTAAKVGAIRLIDNMILVNKN